MKKIKLMFLASILALVGLSGCNEADDGRIAANDLMVTSVSLDITYKRLEVGESFVLTPTITYKDGEVECYTEWRTSNSKIVTVSDTGMVLALKSGSAAITFIAGYKSASCSILVPGNDTPVIPDEPITPVVPDDPDAPQPGEFTISLDTTSINLSVDDFYQLNASTSEQATIFWSSDDDTVATVDSNGLITAVAAGTATITATSNGKTATCEVEVLEDGGQDLPPSDDMTVHIYFFIDYNNADEDDVTGKKLLAKFWWYEDKPIAESGKVPANPTQAQAPTPEFPYFAGWSSHPIIDTKDKLLNLSTYKVEDEGSRTFLFIYGIWTDVQGGMTK